MSPFVFSYTGAVLTGVFVIFSILFWFQSRTSLSRHFVGYLLACVVWLIGNVLADVATTTSMAFWASGIAFIGGCFTASFLLTFTHILCHDSVPKTTTLFCMMLPGFGLGSLAFTPWAIQTIMIEPGIPSSVVPGPAYGLAFIVLLLVMIYVALQLTAAYIHATPIRKNQIAFVGIGFFGVCMAQVIFTLILPLLGDLRFYNLAPQSTIIFAVFAGYAIYRHQLLDVRLFFQRGLVYTSLFSFIVAVYAGGLHLISSTTLQSDQLGQFIVGIGTTIVSVFTIPRLDRRLRTLTDRWFFVGSYDYRRTLQELSVVLHSSLHMDELLQQCADKLQAILRVSSVHISSDKSLITNTQPKNGLIIPIVLGKKIVGTIELGEKKSGLPYTRDDIRLLKTFANQAATAISRVFMYKEVKQTALDLEKKVAERTKELADANQYQTAMLLQISHNLQTPLTILQTKLDSLSAADQHRLETHQVTHTLQHISVFIQQLLRLSKLKHTPQSPSKVTCNVSDLLVELVEEVTTIADMESVTIDSDIPPNFIMDTNPQYIREICMNLLSNAIKYIGEGEKKIILRLSRTDQTIDITIEDTGVGIGTEAMEEIFMPFYRQSTTAEVSGTGIGLAITKQLAQEIGASINVTSTLGEGSRFVVSFPIKLVQQ